MATDDAAAGAELDAALNAARQWAAWFAAEATRERKRAQRYQRAARQACEQADQMVAEGADVGLGVKSLSAGDDDIAIVLTTDEMTEAAALTMLDGLADTLDDATHYAEFHLRRSGKTPVTVCIRRMHHPTPHELRVTAERERDEALAEAQRLRIELAEVLNDRQRHRQQ